MVPRIYITALEADIPLKQAVDALLESGYSRVPVYDDTIDQILGLLYTKDLLNVWREASQIDSLRSLLRPAYFVPEAKKVDELLAELQAMRVHMAIVVDEYGGIAGLVTLEDIVEEIVGEIQDEYDLREELPYQELGDGRFIFLGRVGLNDFNEVMQTNLPENEAETLGGYIYSRIGRVPNAGETVRVAQEPGTTDLVLTVEHVSGRRIRKVRAEMIPQTDDIAPAPGVPYAEEPNPDG
jgi:CBS domain containing-hemolysin-like protein